MKIFKFIETYYSLFGINGVLIRTLYKLSENTQSVLVEVPGIQSQISIRLGSTDVATLKQVFIESTYDWELAVNPSVIIDAGANIGLAAVFFANKYPEAKIYAIEPDISNFEMLVQNTSMYPNITVIHAALWKENKEISLYNPSTKKDAFRAKDKETNGHDYDSSSVIGLTMDNILSSHDIPYVDILKIDIEGSEKEVFANPTSWISKVGVVMIELHDYIKIGCSRNFFMATAEFEGLAQHGETTVIAMTKFLSDTEDGKKSPAEIHKKEKRKLVHEKIKIQRVQKQFNIR